jgi:hypothetical protein
LESCPERIGKGQTHCTMAWPWPFICRDKPDWFTALITTPCEIAACRPKHLLKYVRVYKKHLISTKKKLEEEEIEVKITSSLCPLKGLSLSLSPISPFHLLQTVLRITIK